MKTDLYRSQFRLPYSLYESLKESADQHHRSVNAELVARLESTFSEENRILDMDLGDYADEILAAADAEDAAALAPQLAKRLTSVEQQLQQIIELLKK